jgi:hypothetical protein
VRRGREVNIKSFTSGGGESALCLYNNTVSFLSTLLMSLEENLQASGSTYASSRSGRASLRKPSIEPSASPSIRFPSSQRVNYLVVVVDVELTI